LEIFKVKKKKQYNSQKTVLYEITTCGEKDKECQSKNNKY